MDRIAQIGMNVNRLRKNLFIKFTPAKAVAKVADGLRQRVTGEARNKGVS